MAVSYYHARQFVGQRIVVHGTDGSRHFGVLQNVGPAGIHIRPMTMGTTVSANRTELQAGLTDKPLAVDAENVFFPLLFLPLLALAALWPWYAYPYWGGYGYPYY